MTHLRGSVIMKRINEDIIYAQKVIGNTTKSIDRKKAFHNKSFIYKFTNEDISFYRDYLKNKNNALEIISSGDHIINSILYDTYNIDGFDISRFPKYLLFLKIGAILSLSYEEYLDFFIDLKNDDEYYDDMYSKIRNNLSSDIKLFWDSLFNCYDWNEIYNSILFSTEPQNKDNVIRKNDYLKEDNYNSLKNKIKKANINIKIGNIFNLIDSIDNEHDLINLSNIINYSDKLEYKELLHKIKLSNNGICLTYLYNFSNNKSKLLETYKDENIELIDNKDTNTGIMLYRK